MTTVVPRTCTHCGADFPGTPKSLYCSPAHRQAAYRARIVTQRNAT